jgi:LysM repeat protein
MNLYRVQSCLGMIAVSALLLSAGCSSTSPARVDIHESQVQPPPLVRDRGLELAALRAEMAATRIAAAKKEAELLELRDLVQQLRRENAESRQAFLDLRDQAEQRQRDAITVQPVPNGQAEVQTTHDIHVLKDTVAALAQELGQLRQDLAKSVANEQVKLPVAMTVTAATVADSFSTVTVQPSDTLASLAKRHRTTVEALRKLNVLKGDTLIVGRALALPKSQEP